MADQTTSGAGGDGGTSGKGKSGGKKGGLEVEGGLVCANCKTQGEIDALSRCAGCRRVFYCCRECQKAHWKKGGHKQACKPFTDSTPTDDGTGTTSGPPSGQTKPPLAELDHPCPICRDNEDDYGLEHAMCMVCAQLICSECIGPTRLANVQKCPTCRAPFQTSDAEMVSRKYSPCASCSNFYPPAHSLLFPGCNPSTPPQPSRLSLWNSIWHTTAHCRSSW